MIKTSVDQLALWGGPPAFARPRHVGTPNLGDRDALISRINQIYDRRWLTNNGEFVREFESRIAELAGTKHCVAVCNATIGLEIAIRATQLGGEVLVPSFTFVATAHAVHWQGMTPVFCDIDPATHNLDPADVESRITPRTTGIIGVHVWGRPCAVEALTDIARRHRLALIFDAAHAIACSAGGRMIGGFGDAEVFSFHATKILNSFEGGAVTTDSDELAGRMRLMRNFGFADYDTVIYPGTNGKMNEAAAAMGLTSLESLDSFIEHNRRIYHTYGRGLAGIPGVTLMDYDETNRNNYQYVVLEIDDAGLDRDGLVRLLQSENVLARRYFYPGCHRMEPYRSLTPRVGESLPRTERLTRRVMTLPTGTGMSEEDAEGVCALIRLARENDAEVAARLARTPA